MNRANGHIQTTVDVEIIRARRGKVIVEIDGIRREVRVGDTLQVHADVDLKDDHE